ncbi:proton channel OTOP2-like [Bombina bombina]|uniref:proton channel OTOP2-like n=1 Tax=Bombina bombina TaxID=8345 RepID=UPI00235A4BBE|nr:proton channel OTOP2-like [Bombina bombina]
MDPETKGTKEEEEIESITTLNLSYEANQDTKETNITTQDVMSHIGTQDTKEPHSANKEIKVTNITSQDVMSHIGTQDTKEPHSANKEIKVTNITTQEPKMSNTNNEQIGLSHNASQDIKLSHTNEEKIELPHNATLQFSRTIEEKTQLPVSANQYLKLPNPAEHENPFPPESLPDMKLGTLVPQADVPIQSPVVASHSGRRQSEVWKKGGRLLSALLAINIGLVASVLVSSGYMEHVSVEDTAVLGFLVILMLLSTFWMIFQFYFSCRKNAVLYKDSHAGPVWLRGGLVFFGICSLVLDVFKIGYYISYIECESSIKLIHPMVQSAFIILQTYFLWVSSKHCVQIHTNISRYGLMLILITNLSIWMAAVTDESVHQTSDLEDDYPDLHNALHGSDDSKGVSGVHKHTCQCSNRLCHIFQEGYYYLYPFNIEYSLFASAMTYVMWKNVGRVMDDHVPPHSRLSPCFCFKSIFVGLLLGVVVVLGGVITLVLYKIKVNSPERAQKAHIMFYSFNIVTLSLMSMASLAGSIIYRFDKRDIDVHKNPTRTLDVALLLGAALGQYCIAYYTIVAMVSTTPGKLLNCLNLVYSLLMIVQHTVQNTFIIEGLHREPFKDEALEPEKGLAFANVAVTSSLPDNLSLAFSMPGPDHVVNDNQETHPKQNLKRRLVQEISLFLLLCNIILWLMPAFGARPQLKNNLELNFYGIQIWSIITNICLPFGIFYRMHSAASLLEVFRMS